MDNLQWNKLRTKYFKECVWHDSTDGNKIRIDYAPHDLFEWFKKNIKEFEGSHANSENSNCAIFDVSGSLLIPDVNTEKNLILARAINYIADDVQEDGNKLAREIAEELITLLDKQ